jgi:methionine synthase I (cobalamin-dependent)
VTLADRIASGPLLADGAWGTELQRLGLAAGVLPDHWNLLHPERVGAVAASYVDAGSAIILTNTFRANRVALEAAGLAGELAAINQAGVRISREAAQGRALVFASMGTTGKLVVASEIAPDEAQSAFREQAAALAEGEPDALLLETMSDLEEASLALEQAARRMTEEGASGVGANCGVGIVEAAPVCRRMRAVTTLPLWMKPNAGLPELKDGELTYRVGPEQFASHIPALVGAGANVVGGCCGSGPDFIRAAARALAELCV